MIIGFKRPGISVLIGIVFFIVMVSGIPRIKLVKHLTNPMINLVSFRKATISDLSGKGFFHTL